MRLVGVNIPDNKRIDIALTYIYGIGRTNVYPILEEAGITPEKRSHTLNEEELARLQKAIEKHKIEGDLRAEIYENVKRLRDITSYRGIRHSRGLPVHGQRTRSNARTKRGKRATIGAIRKEVAERMGIK